MKFRKVRTVLMAMAAVGFMIPGGIAAASASASSATPQRSLPSDHQPLLTAAHSTSFDQAFGNVDYNGGPVMPSSTNYLVFWSPKGLSAYGSSEYVTGLEEYWKALAHDSGKNTNTDSVSAQYNDTTGAFSAYKVVFGGAIVDKDAYPKSQCPVAAPVIACNTDAQLQKEVETVAKANHIPDDLSHLLFLVTPPNVESCFTNQAPSYGGCSAGEPGLGVYCAYHENTSISPTRFYSDDPYVTGNPGCDDGNHPNGPSDGALEGGMMHEHNEAITDPFPNDAWTSGYGSRQGEEMGDLCEGQYGTVLGMHNGAKYNQVIDGHYYWYQELYSDQGHDCLQNFTLKGAEPTATFKVTASTGLTLKFNATGSTAPGGVLYYNWQFNDAFGAQTVEKTTPKISHTFPSAGAYSIGLTVYGKNGVAIGTGGIVTTGKSGFTPGFTYSPANPKAGQAVSFTGIANVSAMPVLTYLWEFGDGKNGSGATPQHTYTKAGTYTVELVPFSGVGSAFPGAGAGPIVTEKIKVS